MRGPEPHLMLVSALTALGRGQFRKIEQMGSAQGFDQKAYCGKSESRRLAACLERVSGHEGVAQAVVSPGAIWQYLWCHSVRTVSIT